jgi:hypothetical protein
VDLVLVDDFLVNFDVHVMWIPKGMIQQDLVKMSPPALLQIDHAN